MGASRRRSSSLQFAAFVETSLYLQRPVGLDWGTMPTTYLDQTALIGLGRKARVPEFRKKLDDVLNSGGLRVVLSLWHLVETVHTTKLENAIELAQFIESLRPAWLFERHDVLRMEVAEDFCKYAHIEHEAEPRISTFSAIFAALNRSPDGPRFDIPPARFVTEWWNHPDQMQPLEAAYKGNVDALLGIREMKKQGKMTDDIRNQARRVLFEHTVPTRTPAGLEVGHAIREEYITQAKEESIPTVAIEKAISEHEWDAQGGADRNTLIDKFHFIPALPYVDEIISEDHFFGAVYPAAVRTGYVKARLIGNKEFLGRFA